MQILPEAFLIFVIIIYTLGVELFLSSVNEIGGSVPPQPAFGHVV